MKLGLVLLELGILGCSALAQPASDLLQSGIFAQETRGDLDGAIRIYRQILDAGGAMRLYVAQAQYRLGTCLLRKGDIAGATAAFETVIRDYPGERELVARAHDSMPQDRVQPTLSYRPALPAAQSEWRQSTPRNALALRNSVNQLAAHAYLDAKVGYSFTVPAGWTYHSRDASHPPGTSVDMFDSETRAVITVSAKSKGTNPSAIEKELRAGAKIRLEDSQGRWRDYTLLQPEALLRIGDHLALVATATYTMGSTKRVEYIAWVQSEASRASIMLNVDAGHFAQARARLQPLLDSYRMP